MTSKQTESKWAVFTVYHVICVTLSLETIDRYINVVLLIIIIFGIDSLHTKP